MAKWSSLTAGKNVEVVKGGASADWKYMAVLPVLIIVGIILYLIFRSDTSGPSGSSLSTRRSRLLNRSSTATASTAVTAAGPLGILSRRQRRLAAAAAAAAPVAAAEAPVAEAAAAEAPAAAAEPEVAITANELEPKFNIMGSKYWSFDDEEDAPHLENDGNTFTDFQKAFSMGREYLTEENSMTTFRNENHDTFMHEEKRSFVPTSDVSLSDSRTLATEAFQPVPRDMDRQNASVLLREILAARTEAAHIGLNLGYSSDEQVADLKYWSAKAGPEAELAAAILSRI